MQKNLKYKNANNWNYGKSWEYSRHPRLLQKWLKSVELVLLYRPTDTLQPPRCPI